MRQITGGRVDLRVGTLYGALDRLAAEGLVEQDRDEIGILNTPALTALVYGAAGIAALRPAKSSPVWPAALALAGMAVLPYLQDLFGASGFLAHPARDGYVLAALGAEVFLLCTALASFLFWAYQRRLPSVGGAAA